jgi:hypothetical protein
MAAILLVGILIFNELITMDRRALTDLSIKLLIMPMDSQLIYLDLHL